MEQKTKTKSKDKFKKGTHVVFKKEAGVFGNPEIYIVKDKQSNRSVLLTSASTPTMLLAKAKDLRFINQKETVRVMLFE